MIINLSVVEITNLKNEAEANSKLGRHILIGPAKVGKDPKSGPLLKSNASEHLFHKEYPNCFKGIVCSKNISGCQKMKFESNENYGNTIAIICLEASLTQLRALGIMDLYVFKTIKDTNVNDLQHNLEEKYRNVIFDSSEQGSSTVIYGRYERYESMINKLDTQGKKQGKMPAHFISSKAK